MNEDRIPLRDALARAAVPLAALAAMAAFAQREVDPVAAAESVYLAVLATAGLLAVAFLAPAPAWEAGVGAALATTIVWALPPGPGRGAAMVLLLVGALAVATGRRWTRDSKDPRDVKDSRDSLESRGFSSFTSFTSLLSLSLGLQALLRGGELLFEPQLSFRTLVALLVLPTLGAIATTMLSRRHGPVALVAAGTVLLLAPGWNVATTLGLLGLAAGEALVRPEVGWIARAAAVGAALVLTAWEPVPGIATAGVALALVRPKKGIWVAVAACAAFVAFAIYREASVGENILRPESHLALLIYVLVPAVIFSWRSSDESRGIKILMSSLLWAFPALTLAGWPGGAGPVALLALHQSWRPKNPGDADPRVPLTIWITLLLAMTALLASYPWLRTEPLLATFALFGITKGCWVALLGLALTLQAAGSGRFQGPRAAAITALGLVFLALALHIPTPGTSLLPPSTAVAINATQPTWTIPVTERSVETVVLESSLSNGAGLKNDTPVATVWLRGPDGRAASWIVRAGVETGEWAARRPDVAAEAVLKSPPAWISYVAGDFFGQRYRSLWTVNAAGPFTSLSIERNPALPQEVSLDIHLLEVRQ